MSSRSPASSLALSRETVTTALLISAIFFALYAALAASDITFGDNPELVAAAITNGVAHPPGYPLWIVLGHVASLLPVGTLPFRVNLTASFYHALTVGLVFFSAWVLVRDRAAAIFAAVLLGACSPIFASWSLQAEVFSLNDLFAAAIVLTCLVWLDRPAQSRPLVALAALFGLGLSNQQSLLLLAPLALWTMWCARRALVANWKAIAIALPLAATLFFVPYSHTLAVSQHLSALHFAVARNPGELLDVIERRAYGGFNLVPHVADRGGNAFERLAALAIAAGVPLLFAIAGTIVAALRRRYDVAIAAATIVVFPLLLFCSIANVDVHDELLRAVFSRFALLPLVGLAPFAAFTLRARLAAGAVAGAAIASAVLLLPKLGLAGQNGPRTLFHDIAAALPPNAILLTAGDPVDQSPRYFQDVEGWRPDVTVVTFGLLDLPQYVDALGQVLKVPDLARAGNYAPQARRDVLVRANAGRPFFVTGERGIHAPGPWYAPRVLGVTSQMVPRGSPSDPGRDLEELVRIEGAPGYGDVPAAYWKTNGMGTAVREYYAGGFFTTGIAAEHAGDRAAARRWYERAREYFDDPVIAQRLKAI